ncbi:unnamed protein product, partial [Darwinula stevensoni]
MVDYIADYLENIRDRRVYPDVKPGYLRLLVPSSPPEEPESWDDIFNDVERVIMPGVTHWQSPFMHAYFPALNSFPSLLGDMLADAIGCLGFTWASSPACTELESLVMDWLGEMIGLPDHFLHKRPNSPGGGVIQVSVRFSRPSAFIFFDDVKLTVRLRSDRRIGYGDDPVTVATTMSEATFVSILAARTEAMRKYQKSFPSLEDAEVNSRLVGYCSDQAHSSVEKAGLIGLVKLRCIETDDALSLRGDKLLEAIRKDRDRGLIPFYVRAATSIRSSSRSGVRGFHRVAWCLGTAVRDVGDDGGLRFRQPRGTRTHLSVRRVAFLPAFHGEREELWLHVDAAYAGTAFICPEFRAWLRGVEYVTSIAFNPSKWMLVHFDCTAMWVKNCGSLHRTFNVAPLYLQHENTGEATGFYKRFRALKLWFVIRNYGVKGLQAHVRRGVKLAEEFERHVRRDPRFEIPAKRHLGMVVFRLKGENERTEALLKRMNGSGQVHCVPASLKGRYIIRFTITSTYTTSQDVRRDWEIIQATADLILHAKPRVPLAG